MSHRILIVDDEAGIRQALKQILEYEDLEVRVTASGGEAITVYTEFRPHLVFLDVKMAGLDGLDTLTRIRKLDSRAQVVMISGHGTIATAVDRAVWAPRSSRQSAGCRQTGRSSESCSTRMRRSCFGCDHNQRCRIAAEPFER